MVQPSLSHKKKGLESGTMLWLLPLGIALGHLPTLLEVQEDTDG